MHDNKEREGLDKYKSKDEKQNIRYVFFLFVTPFFLFQKELNHLIDINKRIKSLNLFIYIYQKLANHIITYFALKFLDRRYSKTKKTIPAVCKKV